MIFFSRKKKSHPAGEAFEALIRLGNAMNAERKWPEAAEYYGSALEIQPSNVAIRIQLGHALKEQGLLAQAEDAYRQAQTSNPLDADAYLHLGHVSKMQGNIAQAIDAYRDAARLGATGPIGRDARQELAALGSKVPPVIRIDPSHLNEASQPHLVTALRECRWGEALTIIEDLDNPPSRLKLIKAQVYQILQRYDEAEALYLEMAAQNPGGEAAKMLRTFYIDIGESDKALQSLKLDLETSIAKGLPFSTQVELVNAMLSAAELTQVFEVGSALFISTDRDKHKAARTALDVKRQRVSRILPAKLSAALHDDFLGRSARLQKDGEHPQALLLREEALALEADP
jgi:tetratricopeptide (TPR) repeat protein